MSGCGQGEPDQEEIIWVGLERVTYRQGVGVRRESSWLLIQFGQMRHIAGVG